jgi:hypothetical protein
MKKTLKKLTLAKETLQSLDSGKLEGVAGGDSENTRCRSVCGTCSCVASFCFPC